MHAHTKTNSTPSFFSAPEESGLNKASVDGLAARLSKQLGYAPGSDLEPIVKSLGGNIKVRQLWEMEDPSSGSIVIRGEGDFDIFVAAHTGPVRDRFTIAHELGHYVLHYLWPQSQGLTRGPIMAQRYGSGRVEWEANWFAAGFLMPAEDFRKKLTANRGNLARVADQFGVSMEAARVRAEFLGLVPA